MIKHSYKFLLLLLIIAFVFLKIPYLSLPYFWDESWSYGQAIHYMYKNGLSILPGSIPHSLSKGHPLLFYCLAAFGMKIFGAGLIGSHILPLLISTGVLIMVFYFGKIFFNEAVGLMAAIFTCCQAMFFSQAALLLPEIFIAFCTLLALYGYLKNNLLIYYIGAVAFLLSKETGILLLIFIAAWEILLFIFSNDKTLKALFSRIVVLCLPLIPAISFYILQKKAFGFYLYPLHIDMMEYSPALIFGKVNDYINELFFSGGKFLATGCAGLGLIIIFKNRSAELRKKLAPCFFLIAFSLFYILFMSFQFINLRYTLTAVPVLALSAFAIIYYSFESIPLIRFLAFAAIIIVMSCSTYFEGRTNRETLGYVDFVKCDRAAIHYLAEKNYYQKKICCQFLMFTNMKFPEAGYLPTNRTFSNFSVNENDDFELFILTSYDYFRAAGSFIKQKDLRLEKQFYCGKEWTKIYTKN